MTDLLPSHDDIPQDLPEGVKVFLHLATFLVHLAVIGTMIYLVLAFL
jgi:hypothetical protein